MRRKILTDQKSSFQSFMSNKNLVKKKICPSEIKNFLRKQRSKEYVEMIRDLDFGGYEVDQKKWEEIKTAIKDEFSGIDDAHLYLGIVARCFLGKPFEVHTLNMDLSIIKHYKAGESLPTLMEKARKLALHPDYVFVEVYSDCLRAVHFNGEVSVVEV